MSDPKLFLTCMSHGGTATLENAREIIEPIRSAIDGAVWVLHDTDASDCAAQYLESVKGAGRIIHRPWPRGRHFASMNDTLWCGPMEEGDLVLWTDPLERPSPAFVNRIKGEIGPMLSQAEIDVVYFFGKAYLFRYRETLEYRNTPHWTLTGHNGRAIEWNTIEPDETKVRLNVRPRYRGDDRFHWVKHYASYFTSQPAGSNTCLLGIEQHGGDPQQAFARRETRRLAFRQEMRRRGVPLTLEGLTGLLTNPLPDDLKAYVRGDKVLADFWVYLHGDRSLLKDNHNPADAPPVP